MTRGFPHESEIQENGYSTTVRNKMREQAVPQEIMQNIERLFS